MREIDEFGMGKVMEMALKIVGSSGKFGLSLDMDGIDPNDAPGILLLN